MRGRRRDALESANTPWRVPAERVFIATSPYERQLAKLDEFSIVKAIDEHALTASGSGSASWRLDR
jgi:hypothetical protein